MSMLDRRLRRLEQHAEAATPPPAVLVLLPGEDEAARRAEFMRLHGHTPPAVVRVGITDARLRPDPPD